MKYIIAVFFVIINLSYGQCPKADLTGDCIVDLEDLAVMASQWLIKGAASAPPPGIDIDWIYVEEAGVQGYVSKHEITNEQYCQFLNDALSQNIITEHNGQVFSVIDTSYLQAYCDLRSINLESQIVYEEGIFYVQNRDGLSMNAHPMVCVSWYGATSYCAYYGCRLLRVDEWQAIADYDGSYQFGCGEIINKVRANYNSGDFVNPLQLSSEPYTSPAGYFQYAGYELYDMTGNVWEWTSTVARVGHRVVCGGSWRSTSEECVIYPEDLYNMVPNTRTGEVGFRICYISEEQTIEDGEKITIASITSPLNYQLSADYISDGVDDQVQFQSAIDNILYIFEYYYGGEIEVAPGRYYFGDSVYIGGMTHPSVIQLTGMGTEVATNIMMSDRIDKPMFIMDGSGTRLTMKDFHLNKGGYNHGDVFESGVSRVDSDQDAFILAGESLIENGFDPNRPFFISESTYGQFDGWYTIKSYESNGDSTYIYVNEDLESSASYIGRIYQASTTWNIKGLGLYSLRIAGEQASETIEIGHPIRIVGSSGNDQYYQVRDVKVEDGDSLITLAEPLVTTEPELKGACTQNKSIFWAKSFYHTYFEGVRFENCLGNNVLISEGQQLTFEHCTVMNAMDNGIMLAPFNGESVSDVRINDCSFEIKMASTTAAINSLAYGVGTIVKNITITDNNFTMCPRDCIQLNNYVFDIHISNNLFENTGIEPQEECCVINVNSGRGQSVGLKVAEIVNNTFITSGRTNGISYEVDSCIRFSNEHSYLNQISGVTCHSNTVIGDKPLYVFESANSYLSIPANSRLWDIVDAEFYDLNESNYHAYLETASFAYDVDVVPSYLDQPRHPRNVVVTVNDASDDDLQYRVVLYYVDIDGAFRYVSSGIKNVSEEPVWVSDIVCQYVNEVFVDHIDGSHDKFDSISIGYGDKLGLDRPIVRNLLDSSEELISVVYNQVPVDLTGDVVPFVIDPVNNTIDMSKSEDGTVGNGIFEGDNVSVRYRASINNYLD